MGNIWIICPEINNDDNKEITSHKDPTNDQKTNQNEEVNFSNYNFNNDDDNDNIISKIDQKTNQNEEVNLIDYNFNNDDDDDNIISKNDQKTDQNEEVNLSNYNFNNDDDNDNNIRKKNASGISFENKEKKSNINPIGTYECDGKNFNKYSLEQFQENNYKW